MNKIATLLLILAPIYASAQINWQNPKGIIKSEEIIIEKDKQLVLPSVSRRFTSIAVKELVLDTMAITYTPKNILVKLPKIPIKLRPITMKTEALEKTFWGNFKFGYGNYLSPLVKADVSSKRNDEYAISVHFKHFSSKKGPVDGDNSGLSTTNGYVSGKLFLNKITLSGNLSANFKKHHLYGYKNLNIIPETQKIEQKSSNYMLNFGITDNNIKKKLHYKAHAGVYFFNASNSSLKENDIFAKLSLDFNLIDNLKIKTLSELHFSSPNTAAITSNSRMYFKIKPYAVYSMKPFTFEIGASIYSIKDSINNYNNKLHITPHIIASYALASSQVISAGITGDVTWQSARTQFAINPYLNTKTPINNEVKPIEIFLKANGKLTTKVDFTLGYSASIYKVYSQFINNASNQAIFDINYQLGNNIIHSINSQINYIALKNIMLSVYGKYLIFNFKNIDNPYHTPQIDVGLKAKVNLKNRLDAEFSLFYLDKIYVLENTSFSNIQLNKILDMNISATYKINTIISIFIKTQNILGNQYQYFYNYPTKGFQALAGISLTF